jgi:hypothetical protein
MDVLGVLLRIIRRGHEDRTGEEWGDLADGGMSLVTSGRPAPSPSRAAPGNPSHDEGKKNTSEARSRRGTSARLLVSAHISRKSQIFDETIDLLTQLAASHEEQADVLVLLVDQLHRLQDGLVVLLGGQPTHMNHDPTLGGPPKFLSNAQSVDRAPERRKIDAVVNHRAVAPRSPARREHAVEGAS